MSAEIEGNSHFTNVQVVFWGGSDQGLLLH